MLISYQAAETGWLCWLRRESPSKVNLLSTKSCLITQLFINWSVFLFPAARHGFLHDTLPADPPGREEVRSLRGLMEVFHTAELYHRYSF